MNLPGQLDVALAAWLARAEAGGLAGATASLTHAYRAGENSSHVNLDAYLTTRLPATFAANARVLNSVSEVWPGFSPQSLLDVGAGPGVATWAALSQWHSIAGITQVETDARFAACATQLNRDSGLQALQSAKVLQCSLQDISAASADLVVASYVLAELPIDRMSGAADTLWQTTRHMLVLVEPGTPQGFQRLRIIRNHLLQQGAHVVAPCTHAKHCPMSGDDWCHFKVRLARSRAHMHAKSAVVPFEDEAFSYLALARDAPALQGGRVIAPPETGKAGVRLRLCDESGLSTLAVARRDKASYKLAKHMRWGDLWT